ncbi:MAG: hypothetical protein ACM3OC_09790 [Deltaproteobacteria bacterium]
MRKNRGQNIAEYSILIALVVGAAVAMQVFVKRGVQGRMKDVTDHTGVAGQDVGGDGLTFSGKGYEPYYQHQAADVSSNRQVTENVQANGQITHDVADETTKRLTGSYEESTTVSGYTK